MLIALEVPDLQIDFAAALIQVRDTYLQDALLATVKSLSISMLDRELLEYASEADLSLLASKGLRGELVFAVPIVLRTNPHLLGYYRLLNGYSRKAFYNAETGISKFAALEDKGVVSANADKHLPDLCKAINKLGITSH